MQIYIYMDIYIYLGWLLQVLVHPSSSHWAQLEGRWVVQREVDVFPAPLLSPEADPSPSRGRSACSPAKPNSSCHHRAWAVTGVPRGFFIYTLTHINTCVIGENTIVGESHIFLLPLFVERAPTAFQQDALKEVIKTQEWYLMEKFSSLFSGFQQHEAAKTQHLSFFRCHRVSMECHTPSRHVVTQPSHFNLSGPLLGPCPLQRVTRYNMSLCECVSYLFNGNGASTAQVSFKICTPSVWVTSSPALHRQVRVHQFNLRVAACFITKTLEAFRKEDNVCAELYRYSGCSGHLEYSD